MAGPELLKSRVSSYEIFPVQENFFRPLGSTTALDQPAVNAGFVYYINDINNITPDVAGLINL